MASGSSERASAPGDVYVVIEEAEHELFERQVARTPDASNISVTSVVTVVLPFVPVMATIFYQFAGRGRTDV